MDINVNQDTVIVFDLDDTLYNEVDFLKSAYQEIAKKIDPNNPVLYGRMFSMYRRGENVFNFLTSLYNVPIANLIEWYRQHVPNITLFDGVKDVLHAIKKHEGKIAIITDGRSSTQRNKISQLGVDDFIDLIIISEEIKSEKPNEHNYRLVEEHFKATDYTYIADNLKKDFITPNKRNWNSIALVDNGKNIHINKDEYFLKEDLAPKQFIHSFFDINIIANMK